MESTEGVLGSNATGTDARHNQHPFAGDVTDSDAGNVRAVSVDRITVEKIVLESTNGSREVLLTKNETSRRLSLSKVTRPCVVRRTKDERPRSTLNDRFRVSAPTDAFTSKAHADFQRINGQSKLPVLARYRKSDGVGSSNKRQRIKPIKFIKHSIGSVVIDGTSSASAIVRKNKVPPKIPEKPSIERDFNSSSTAIPVSPERVESPEDLSQVREGVIDGTTVARVKRERAIEREISEVDNATKKSDARNDDDTSTVGIERGNETSEVSPHVELYVVNEIAERDDARSEREVCARADRDAQDRLERSQTTIEDLQRNLGTRIHDSTARSYKERLLSLRANYAPRLPSLDADSSGGERLSRGFDQDFLERHNLDKQLKIEERRPLETDFDYISDNERGISESEDRPSGEATNRRKYCDKVTEVERRWSGEFLDGWLRRNHSSESSKSSYVEEFGSVSSRESIVEDRDARSRLFDRRRSRFAERRASLDEAKRRTPEEALLEDTTVSTVDSDSCLEDRIKAVDEDIARVANGAPLTDDNDDLDAPGCAYDNEKDKVQRDDEVEAVDPIIVTTSLTITRDREDPKEGGVSDDVDGLSGEQPNEEETSNCEKNIGTTAESKERASTTSLIDDKDLLIGRNDVKAVNTFAPINPTELSDPVRLVIYRAHRSRDGYANLIKEFAMETAGSSKTRKEEKQKKKLGFRRLLPAIFSPKDSRKDYKKKEQKERKRYDERHFARYQQNGNYTRSPDTMNLNEDIKRNVKLDNSLNGSIIEERLDEIKRELFPEQGPITSTPDHFLQTDDARMLRDRARTQRSYTTDSSLSSIAPDERWTERSGQQLVISPDIRKYEQRQRREEQDGGRRYGGSQLERKHSLQEPSHAGRNYWFQRNHASSGRISAPPSERYLVRPRAIHPVDRPLPEIPQSRTDLSNYENYRDEIDPCLRDDHGDYDKDTAYAVDNAADYQNQAGGLYQNNNNNRNIEAGLIHAPQSVAAQVKITRQPIVNQTQRAPLVGRTPKYPSPGSSQKSGDYADSSCTPNSSQKSAELSPSSSKSGEYYLHSPRSSARNSPAERAYDDARDRIYENDARSAAISSDRYAVDEHVYDETPSSPCREEYSARAVENSPAKKGDPAECERNRSPNRRSPAKGSFQRPAVEDNEAVQVESKREIEKSREDYLKARGSIDANESLAYGQAERTPPVVQNVSPSRTGVAATTSPSAGPRASARRSQPNDQILIASPKRGEVVYQSRVPRPLNEIRLRDAESPVPMTDSRDCIAPGIVPVEARDPYDSQDFAVSGRSAGQRTITSCGFSKGISRPEPIYVHRKQSSPSRGDALAIAEGKEDGRESDRSSSRVPYGASESRRGDVDERVAWVEGQASTIPQTRNTEAGQTSVESDKAAARSPTRPANMARGPYQQRQPAVVVQQPRTLSAMSASSSEGRQTSPVTISQDKVYASASSLQREPTYEQRQRQPSYQVQQQTAARQQGREIVYVQRVAGPTYAHSTCGVSPQSPSKRETRQHLEAYYWQQKALESQRRSAVSQTSGPAQRQIDLPEVREAVYWQQLKKLDEEQQRRIYERNLMDDAMYEAYRKSPAMAANACQAFGPNNAMTAGSLVHGDGAYWGSAQQRLKVSPAGKLPLMQTPKGQNQPVLIVRPQQALRDRQEMSIKSVVPHSPREPDVQRSKSASPHFHRGVPERSSLNVTRAKPDGGGTTVMVSLRKPETGGVTEDNNDSEGRSRPHPIFKRGSLTAGESAEYGSVGPKRVSFSNQPQLAGPELTAGSWPTKHGTAPEPPTRRHRNEDSTSDTDSVFSYQEQRRDAHQNAAAYGARGAAAPFPRCRTGNISSEQEYDADRPLPPLPKDCLLLIGRRGNSARNYICRDARWHGEEQRDGACQRRHEEEWNPDGKGRQSNDTGGSVRGEIEPGSNELTPGRRSGGGGGGGGGVGGGGGGSVLGIGSGGGGSGVRGTSGGRSRDEPRRHTLGGDHQPSLHHQQFNAAQLHPLHPHHLPPPHGQYGTPPSRHTTMDLEMGTKSRQRKSPVSRGYAPSSPATYYGDEDPGIMSEAETASTGFRRGARQRSSLPVVRTPSKTLERPLGLVFLQYRNETKRALLPNEITSIDTVKALFVRSFPKQLTMKYLDSPHVKVYIHDSNKDMFYELEDLRSHLRDIRDRSVLRLFESADGVTGMPGLLGVPGGGSGLPPHWEDQSYFSEPEFDSDYQHQHIHKTKAAKNLTSDNDRHFVGGSSTLPRGGPLLRAYSPAASSVVGGPNATPTQPKTLTTPGGGGMPPAKPLRSYQCGKSPLGSLRGFSRDNSVSLYSIPDRLHGESGYMSSPERGGGSGRYPPVPYSASSSYEDPYYSQYSGTVTPVIDEEASDTELLEESYSLYGVKPPGRPPSGPPRSPFPSGAPPPLPPGGQSYDATRIRVEHMERQLANLTGLVQKALTHAPHTSPSPREYLQVPPGRDPYARSAGAGDEFDKHSSSSSASLPDDSYLRTDVKPPKLGKDKSVSFEKSVSFSDEPPDMNSPKQHSPQHAADTKPTKPAIKSSTLPRMSSQERDRHKPTPPPKPAALVAGQYVYRDLALTPEMYNQLRGLQKKAKDLRQEVRNLRRMSQAQAHTVRETIRDTFITIRAMLLSGGDAAWTAGDAEKIRLSREEDLYKQEMIRLEKDLTELESTVEELRGNVINRKTRVNMSDVENMALILSKSSKTVADLKVRFPSLQEGMKGLLSSEMEKVVREEKFLKEEPERLESALKRCKKLTGTLVTLKRLASVQEQRLPNAASVDAEDTPSITQTTSQHSKAAAPVPAERTVVGSASVLGGGGHPLESSAAHQQRPENALDALLDELQTFSRPGSQMGQVPGTLSVHQGSTVLLADVGRASSLRDSTSVAAPGGGGGGRAPSMSDIGRKGSVDSSSGALTMAATAAGMMGLPGMTPGASGTLRRLHSYPSSSDTDTSPPIARLQVSLQEQQQQPGLPVLPQGFLPGQKPPVPERNAELLQLASVRRVPPPPPPRTSSRSPLASPTSPQLPPRNHPCSLPSGGNATLRRPAARANAVVGKEGGGKPPMALPPDATAILSTVEAAGDNNKPAPPVTAPTSGVAPPTHNSSSSQSSAVLSTSNSSSCESVNSQEGLQSKRGRQEQLEQRHQELLRKQKALQEQYARLQQLQRNAAGLTTVPPAPPDLLKKTGSESNLLAKMGLGLSAASSGSLTSLSIKPQILQETVSDGQARIEITNGQAIPVIVTTCGQVPGSITTSMTVVPSSTSGSSTIVTTTSTTTTSKVYETDIL